MKSAVTLRGLIEMLVVLSKKHVVNVEKVASICMVQNGEGVSLYFDSIFNSKKFVSRKAAEKTLADIVSAYEQGKKVFRLD